VASSQKVAIDQCRSEMLIYLASGDDTIQRSGILRCRRSLTLVVFSCRQVRGPQTRDGRFMFMFKHSLHDQNGRASLFGGRNTRYIGLVVKGTVFLGVHCWLREKKCINSFGSFRLRKMKKSMGPASLLCVGTQRMDRKGLCSIQTTA